MNRDERDTWWKAYVVGLLAWAAASIAAYSLMGCRPRVDLPQGIAAIPVSVVAWPSPIKARCDLSGLPAVPDIALLQKPDGDPMTRLYITAREMADLLSWLKDVKHAYDSADRCLRLLSEPP